MTTCAFYDLEKPDRRILNRTDFGGCMYKEKKKPTLPLKLRPKKNHPIPRRSKVTLLTPKWTQLACCTRSAGVQRTPPARRRYCLLVQYLALGGRHFSEERLRDFGPLHLLLDLVVDGGVDVEDGALRLPVPLAGQRRGLHLAWGEDKCLRHIYEPLRQSHRIFVLFF